MDFKEEYKEAAEEMTPSPEVCSRIKNNVLKSISSTKKQSPLKAIAIYGGTIAACLILTVCTVSLLPKLSSEKLTENSESCAADVSLMESAVANEESISQGSDDFMYAEDEAEIDTENDILTDYAPEENVVGDSTAEMAPVEDRVDPTGPVQTTSLNKVTKPTYPAVSPEPPIIQEEAEEPEIAVETVDAEPEEDPDLPPDVAPETGAEAPNTDWDDVFKNYDISEIQFLEYHIRLYLDNKRNIFADFVYSGGEEFFDEGTYDAIALLDEMYLTDIETGTHYRGARLMDILYVFDMNDKPVGIYFLSTMGESADSPISPEVDFSADTLEFNGDNVTLYHNIHRTDFSVYELVTDGKKDDTQNAPKVEVYCEPENTYYSIVIAGNDLYIYEDNNFMGKYTKNG